MYFMLDFFSFSFLSFFVDYTHTSSNSCSSFTICFFLFIVITFMFAELFLLFGRKETENIHMNLPPSFLFIFFMYTELGFFSTFRNILLKEKVWVLHSISVICTKRKRNMFFQELQVAYDVCMFRC